jgi:hypothetical protein
MRCGHSDAAVIGLRKGILTFGSTPAECKRYRLELFAAHQDGSGNGGTAKGEAACKNDSVRTSAERTGATGVAIVEMIVNDDLGWIFRRQDQAGTDYGIDAHIEIVEPDGKVTGRLLAVQIKAGPHYFRRRSGDTFVANVSTQHLTYWLGHSLPVLFILVDIEARVAYWHLVHEPIELTPSGGKLYVSAQNRLSADAKRELRSFTQTRAAMKAEEAANRKEAARLSALLKPEAPAEVSPETPSRQPEAWEIEEHAEFWSSLDELPNTEEVAATVTALLGRAVRDPLAAPAVKDGVRIIKTPPYQGRPGFRLAYFVAPQSNAIVLLQIKDYDLMEEDDDGDDVS